MKDNHMKSLKLNYFFSILKSVMTFLFPIISFPYASRILGVSNLGLVSVASSVVGYFGLFASLGISIYATREGAKIREDKDKLTKFSKEVFIINLVSTAIVYAVFLVVLFFMTSERYFLVMLLCSLSIWFSLFSVEWLYQIEEEFSYISIRSMVFQVISLILLFVLVKSENDYVQYAFIQTFAAGGSCILNVINSRKYVNLRTHCKLEFKKHFKPIFTIFGISAASSIYINLDTVMLKWIHSDYEAGLYTAAVKMINMIKMLVNSLSVILLARLSNYLSNKKKDEYFELLQSGFSMNMSIAIPSAVGIFMIARYVILMFSGKDYIDATVASQILAVNVIFAIIDGMIYYQILLPHRMDIQACMGTIMGAVTDIILNCLFIPKYKINGASFATLISEMMVFFCFVIFLRKKINVFKLLKEVPKVLFASIPIVLICLGVNLNIDTPIIGCVIAVPLSAIAYMIVLKLVHGVFAEQVFSIIKQIYSKIMRK